jgi:hypothetical protein
MGTTSRTGFSLSAFDFAFLYGDILVNENQPSEKVLAITGKWTDQRLTPDYAVGIMSWLKPRPQRFCGAHGSLRLAAFDFAFIFGDTFAKRNADRLKPVLLEFRPQFGTLSEV